MTRKDYLELAESLKAALLLSRTTTQPEHGSGQKAVETASNFIASAIARNDPKFDRERFLKNAGVQS